jgi:signal transduction histidine kinase
MQEEERKRIARELHDDTAPTLSYLCLELDAIMIKSPNLSEEHLQRLRELREKINQTQENIRRFSHELHPAILDNLGLEPALEVLVSELNSKGKMQVDLEVKGQKENCPMTLVVASFHIGLQEALHNA